MSLTLEISLLQSRVFLGGEIVMELVLFNLGDDSIETASLFDNNTITNIVLSNEQDEWIGTYNHVSRQRLLEKTEPRTDDLRLITLDPGSREIRSLNICTWHWLSHPGVYLLRGLYSWKGKELLTEPLQLKVAPANLVSVDYQWSYHYGEKYLLESTWVVQNGDGGFCAYVRQSARFHPQIVNFNPKLHEQARPFAPRLSFNATLIGGGPTWVAWLDGGAIEFLCTRGGVVDVGPTRIHSGLEQLSWVAPPLATGSNDVYFFCAGAAGGGAVKALQLRWGKRRCRQPACKPCEGQYVGTKAVCEKGQCIVR